jgi:hypothetical protein
VNPSSSLTVSKNLWWNVTIKGRVLVEILNEMEYLGRKFSWHHCDRAYSGGKVGHVPTILGELMKHEFSSLPN